MRPLSLAAAGLLTLFATQVEAAPRGPIPRHGSCHVFFNPECQCQRSRGIILPRRHQPSVLWSFLTRNPIDYTPAGAASAVLYGTSPQQQVGMAVLGGQVQACVWNVTGARGHVSLHRGAVSSTALGCDDSQQVGFASFGPANQQASVWSGSSTSWASLHPSSASTSQAFAVRGSTSWLCRSWRYVPRCAMAGYERVFRGYPPGRRKLVHRVRDWFK